jgi:hypothetical protein
MQYTRSNAQKVLAGKSETDHFEELSIDGRINQ